jgi:hypothetical protein
MRFLPRLPLALVALASCATYRPPFVQPAVAGAPTDPHQATLVFLWPSSSCDPPGYFTLATADGRFLGGIARGSRLTVSVPARETTVVGWNGVLEETSGAIRKGAVPVLRADLAPGRTYYVRMLFGEWTDQGPPEPIVFGTRGRLSATRGCVGGPDATSSVMVVFTPGSREWRKLPEWVAELEAFVPDRAAGQAWLDANRGLLEPHVAVGQDRYLGMRPEVRRLVTIVPADGE